MEFIAIVKSETFEL